MADIISFGHSAVDIFFDVPAAHLHTSHDNEKELSLTWGAKYEVENLHTSVGGNAHNVTQGLIRLGIDAGLFTAFGKDVFGKYAREFLTKSGIDTKYVSQIDKTNVSTILNVQADRTLLAYHSDEHVTFDIAHIEQEDPAWIFLTSFGYDTFDELYELVREYKESNPTVNIAYNPGGKELVERPQYKEILPFVDVLLVNKTEAELIIGRDVENEDELLEGLYRMTHGMIVVTVGGEGSFGYDGETKYHLRPFPTNLVEKTGAGDAFSSGVIAALYYKEPFDQALRWGAAQSAAVIQVAGASIGLLTKNAMETALAENASIIAERI